MSEKKSELNLGGGNNILVHTAKLVSMKDKLVLFTNGKSIELDVSIKADFDTIPEESHQMLLHMMTARYGGVVNCYTTASPFIKEAEKKRRWYQIWK